jgi:hypothetical protein
MAWSLPAKQVGLCSPGVVSVILPHILVLALGRTEMHGVSFTGTLLIPLSEQVNGVFHDPRLCGAFEAQQPAFGITLLLPAGFAEEFHTQVTIHGFTCRCAEPSTSAPRGLTEGTALPSNAPGANLL